MIVDTSALIAVLQGEPGSEAMIDAIDLGGRIPAPVLVEYRRVVTKRGARENAVAEASLRKLRERLQVEPFTAEDAELAAAANLTYGAGNRRGGRLNLVDLMVYAVAKRLRAPILCTGGDFAATDAEIHPASRTD